MPPKIQFLLRALITALVAISTQASAAWSLNVKGVEADIGLQASDLHMLIALICAIIGALVYVVLIWSLVKHRKSNLTKAGLFHKNTAVEIIWTIIPILILVAMVIPSIHVVT